MRLARLALLLFLALPSFGLAAESHGADPVAGLGKQLESIPGARISSRFGMRRLGGVRRPHFGLDIAAPAGTEVRPYLPGYVIRAGHYGSYGYMVEVYHGKGVATRYAHLGAIHARLGGFVGKESSIGLVGSTGRSTGSHLHFEVRIKGRPINPMLLARRQVASR